MRALSSVGRASALQAECRRFDPVSAHHIFSYSFILYFLHARNRLNYTQNWLFFGERQQAHDFFYQRTIEAWQSTGVLQRLDLAEQTLYLPKHQKFYVISSGVNGIGETENSGKTPRGWHEVAGDNHNRLGFICA